MSNTNNNVILACERSAGHIFPALAIGHALCKAKDAGQPPRIFVFATASGLKRYIYEEGFGVIGRGFAFRNLLLESFWRIFEAPLLLGRYRPKLVIGFGGRDGFFLVLFASLLGIKTAIYEPNVTMGKANKMLRFFTKALWRGFIPAERDGKTRVIGVPLRKNIRNIDPQEARQQLGFGEKPVILCFGGSQGSSFLNQIFMRFVEESHHDFQVIHLTGSNEYFQIQQFYTTIKRKAFVRDFYYNMETLYSAADIVICRAGAATLAEICFYRCASVLIPHPQASNHQRENARYFAGSKAALMFEQGNFSFEEFRDSLHQLLVNPARRQSLRDNMNHMRGGVAFEDFCNSFSC